jgi:eukaryotic-like serine/threonine-protein kinase
MVGQNIGKYRVEDRLGRGGMGTVYRAVDETLHREVAIKVLNAELNDPEVAKRFRAEAITVARLSHPGIATIYELFQHDGQWLMVMEFVRGETLEHLVDRMGALSPQRAAELCMQSLAALAHAHSMGVVHRDLKPANLMITETGSVKIMDFGIARVAGTEHLTNAGYMMGTPAYMAPEQVIGHEIDARADLYAMGVVFYRLTTAKLPFKGDTPFAMAQSQVNEMPTPVALIRSDLPPWVEQLVAKALSKAPEQRFQSAVEFHEAFARCLAGLPMTTTGAMQSASAVTAILTPAPPSPTGTISSRFQMASPEAPTGYASPQPYVPGRDTAAHPPAAAAPAPTSPAKTSAVLVAFGAAALVILLAGVGSLWWIRMRSPQPSTTSSTAPASDQPAGASPAIPTSTVPGGVVPPAAVSAPASPVPAPPPGSTTGAAGGTTTSGAGVAQRSPTADAATTGGANTKARGAAPSDASSTPPSAQPVAPPAAAARTPTDASDAQIVFPDVKVLLISGRRAQDRDALLSLVSGQVTLLNRQGGTIIASTPYKSIERATYVRARNPKWDPAFFSPPDNLDMPGILPTARHWLVLQGRGSYLILQLNANTWQKVLEAIEGRTGVKVERN